MNETEVRSRLRKAMGEYDYKPRSSREIEASLVRGAPSPHLGAMGIVAAIVAILIVVSLVYVRAHSTHPTIPAASPSPSSSIPVSVLEGAHIGAAGAFVSHPDLVGTVGDRTVTLVGAYADVRAMSLIFRVSPASDAELGMGLWTEFGPVDPSYPLTVGPDGYQYFDHHAGPPQAAGGVAHLRGIIWDHWTSSDNGAPEAGPQTWSFAYSLEVHAATPLPVQQGVIPVGSWKVTIVQFDMTPSTIYLHAVIDGPPPPSGVSGRPSPDDLMAIKSIAMIDDAGKEVGTGACGSRWALSSDFPREWELNCEWARPTHATTYRLVITGGGGQYSDSVNIPGPPTS